MSRQSATTTRSLPISAKQKPVSCSFCRARRRACKPPPGASDRFPCALCLDQGKRCAGPASDGRTGKGRLLRSEEKATGLAMNLVAQPGPGAPSSPSWRIVSSQLELALQWHLVQVGLSWRIQGLKRRGMSGPDPLLKLLSSVDRITEMDPIDELSFYGIQLGGLCFSDHSIIFGTREPVNFMGFSQTHPLSSNISIGLQREALLERIRSRTLKVAEGLHLKAETPEVAIGGLVMLLSTFGAKIRGDLVTQRTLQCVLQIGIELMRQPKVVFDRQTSSHVKSYLQDVARNEMLSALSDGKASMIESSLFEEIFETKSYPVESLESTESFTFEDWIATCQDSIATSTFTSSVTNAVTTVTNIVRLFQKHCPGTPQRDLAVAAKLVETFDNMDTVRLARFCLRHQEMASSVLKVALVAAHSIPHAAHFALRLEVLMERLRIISELEEVCGLVGEKSGTIVEQTLAELQLTWED
ncbi:hypothetical protein T439DRAFT_382143 [Meredithblackwellia eburnea MCA 4105]